MIKYMKGVEHRDLSHDMLHWIPYIYSAWHDMFPESDMVITSGFREGHPGAHGRGEAVDIRRHVEYLQYKYVDFCRKLQTYYGVWLGVVLEPEWGKGPGYTGEHIHIQLK
jgi:hypothetical protein